MNVTAFLCSWHLFKSQKEDFRPVAKKLYEFFNQEEIKDGQNRLETITEAEGNN